MPSPCCLAWPTPRDRPQSLASTEFANRIWVAGQSDHKPRRLSVIVTFVADVFEPCARTHASREAVVYSRWHAPFTLFEARSINFAIVVYAIICTSVLDLH